MIRKNTMDCKLIFYKNSNSSGFSVVSNALNNIQLGREVCPNCGCVGNCRPHASYERWLIDFEDRAPVVHRIVIPRVICSCGATHAILPDPIIPYDQYSLFYIIFVLAIYSCHLMTIETICNRYMITPGMLYRWLRIYSEHRREWQGLLKSTTSDIRSSLLELAHKDPYSLFATTFIQTTTRSFFQTHANPANCRRNLQFGFFPVATHTT